MPIQIQFLFLFLLMTVSCGSPDEPRFSFNEQGREVPVFSSDNAFEYVEQQLSFGPRYPNSEGHRLTGKFLVERMEQYAGEGNVFVQAFEHEGYNGEVLELKNIISAFNLQNRNRILLAAHWDTRPRAEEDSNHPENPIMGADDGASGVAVLLELARIMSENQPPVGVDIIFFDGEDYGESGDMQNYFLGSRFWGDNPPVAGYNPRFGILLDMVGGENAVFPKEGYSMNFAPSLMNAVWDVANKLGYSDIFIDEQGALIQDDHIIVQQKTGIPMINIIHHRRNEEGGAEFPPYWHTLTDDIGIIDPQSLQVVGELVTELIYNRVE